MARKNPSNRTQRATARQDAKAEKAAAKASAKAAKIAGRTARQQAKTDRKRAKVDLKKARNEGKRSAEEIGAIVSNVGQTVGSTVSNFATETGLLPGADMDGGAPKTPAAMQAIASDVTGKLDPGSAPAPEGWTDTQKAAAAGGALLGAGLLAKAAGII